MNISIRNKIYLSFFLLVLLFIINGTASIFTLKNNRKLAENISKVINPTLESTGNFEDLVTQSKIYTTNWVFLRSDQDDKDALKYMQDSDYPRVKSELNAQLMKLDDEQLTDSIHKLFNSFEELITIEKKMMASLNTFEDYNDPVKKLEGERVVEDELLPRTSELIYYLDSNISYLQDIVSAKNEILAKSSQRSLTIIYIFAIAIICIGVFLSFYMAGIIITPINKIREIVNDLGKGIIRKPEGKRAYNEIGEMISSVNNLSEKLEATASFAQQIGNRNFDAPYQPLSENDTLGKSLIVMRDNLKTTDQALNEAQHIAHMGSWERDFVKNKVIWTDELYRIFDLDPTTFNISFGDFFAFVHPDDIEFVRQITKGYEEDHLPYSYECRIITWKRVTKTISVIGKVVLDSDNKLIKTYGVIQDITSRKKAEEALHKSETNLRTIFNNTDVSYVLLDDDLNIVYYNKNANSRFQIQSLGALTEGAYFIDCLPEERKKASLERCRKVMRGDCINYESSFTTANGSLVWGYMRMFPVSDERKKIHGMVMAMSDITQQKQLELQREQITADLLQRNNDLEQFAYIVSHNLRSPVANIIGLSEMLDGENLSDEMNEVITGLSYSSEKLDSVIMDLNEVLKVRNELSENKISVCLPGLVQDITASIKSMIDKESAIIEFDFSEADKLLTIKSYIHSIFYNLITNAIKYRQPDTNPVIKIKSYKQDGRMLIAFCDNGMGIDLIANGEKVFGLYKRFHTHIEGKGLGLFMTKTQVETLGGKISIQSEVNKGTTFKTEFII
jgi:PAS domain S-box-containing protein